MLRYVRSGRGFFNVPLSALVRAVQVASFKRPFAAVTTALIIITSMGPAVAEAFSINQGPAPLTATAQAPTFPQQNGSVQQKPYDTSTSGGLDRNLDNKPGAGAKKKMPPAPL